ncbi:MAG: hypothetical protein IJH99_03245 [Eubacterium sp.]|nr:hypothetical protein [Eubacterium sp.]
MKNEALGLTVSLRKDGGNERGGFWTGLVILALFAAGLAFVCAEALPSANLPWAVYFLLILVCGFVLLVLYQTNFGRWVLPAGLGIVPAVCLIFHRRVLGGLGVLGDDLLQLYTKRTGRLTLGFALADQTAVLWGIAVVTAVIALLVSYAAFKGSFIPVLPLLIPVYIGTALGFVTGGAGVGFVSAGAILLLMQRVGKVRKGQALQLVFAAVLVFICLGIGLSAGRNLHTGLSERLARTYHEKKYHTQKPSMPEGQLANLGVWNKSDTPALTVAMEVPEKLYLRGEVYEIYTGTSWEKQNPEVLSDGESLFYWLHEDGFFGQGQIGLASRFASEETPAALAVETVNACSGHGYVPYAVCGNTAFDAERLGDNSFGSSPEMTYLPGSVPEWYRVQQTLAADQDRENIAAYLAEEQAYAAYVKENDLQMTQDSWEVVDRQLSTADEGRTLAEIRTIIRDYLAQRVVYDESVRTLNGSGDFLQYFLEQSGSGYNVHYATAAVLMLRYFGVPARYVEGYFLPADQAEAYAAGQPVTLTEENAHAWAEYYLNGVGFVPFEVTPGYVDDEELELGSDDDAEQYYEGNQMKFARVQRPEQVAEPEQDRVNFSFKAVYLLWLVPVVLIVLLVIIARKRLLFRKAMEKMDAADNREAITLRYGYAAALLSHSEGKGKDTGTEDALGRGKDVFTDAQAALLNREAMFSSHEMTDGQRTQMENYAKAVLDRCKKDWSFGKRIKYRLWECLY